MPHKPRQTIAFHMTRNWDPGNRVPYASINAALMEALAAQEEGVRMEAYGADTSFTVAFDHEGRLAVVRHLYHPKLYGVRTHLKMCPWSASEYAGDLDKLETCWRTTSVVKRKDALWELVQGGLGKRVAEYMDTLQSRYGLALNELEGYATTLRQLSGYTVTVEGPENPQENNTWEGMATVRDAARAPDPQTLLDICNRAWTKRRPR